MATVTIMPIRSRFPHVRPRLTRRGLGNGGALWQSATAPLNLAYKLGSSVWGMPAGGYPTLDQVKAANAQDIIRASTDPNSGVVNSELAQAQIAKANAQIDAAYQSGMQIPASQLLNLPNTPSVADLLGLSSNGGSSLSSFLGGVRDIAIIGALAVGGYFLYKAVK